MSETNLPIVEPKRVTQATQAHAKTGKAWVSGFGRVLMALLGAAAGAIVGVLAVVYMFAIYTKEKERGEARKEWEKEQADKRAKAIADGQLSQEEEDERKRQVRPQANNGTSASNTKMAAAGLAGFGASFKMVSAILPGMGLGILSTMGVLFGVASGLVFGGVYTWLRFREKSRKQVAWDKAHPDGGPPRVNPQTNFGIKMFAWGSGVFAMAATLFAPIWVVIVAAVTGVLAWTYNYQDARRKELVRSAWERTQQTQKVEEKTLERPEASLVVESPVKEKEGSYNDFLKSPSKPVHYARFANAARSSVAHIPSQRAGYALVA